MMLPSRRWFLGAASLALVAPLALWWPGASLLFLVLDALWMLALLVDGVRGLDVGPRSLEVERLAPPPSPSAAPCPSRTGGSTEVAGACRSVR